MNQNTTMSTPLQLTTDRDKTYTVSLINLVSLFNNCELIGINNLQDFDSKLQQATRLMINGASNNMQVEDLTGLLKFMDEIAFMFKEAFIEIKSNHS